jgi:hypothetical protein
VTHHRRRWSVDEFFKTLYALLTLVVVFLFVSVTISGGDRGGPWVEPLLIGGAAVVLFLYAVILVLHMTALAIQRRRHK